ncbi:MAG: Spy/CpxP family protein refolding chaperone [bacterium]
MNIRNTFAVMLVGSVMGAGVAGAAQESLLAGGSVPILQTLVDLNLTVAQEQDIKSILKTYRPVMRQAVDGTIVARKSLFEAIHAEAFNEAAVRQASQLAAAREVDLSVLHARLVADLKGVLTVEQKAVLQKHRAGAEGRFDRGIQLARTLVDRWIDATNAR